MFFPLKFVNIFIASASSLGLPVIRSSTTTIVSAVIIIPFLIFLLASFNFSKASLLTPLTGVSPFNIFSSISAGITLNLRFISFSSFLLRGDWEAKYIGGVS